MTGHNHILKLVDTSPLPQLESRVVVAGGASLSIREASRALAEAKQLMTELSTHCDFANAWLQRYF